MTIHQIVEFLGWWYLVALIYIILFRVLLRGAK